MSKKLSFLLPMAIMMMVVMVFFLPAKTLAAESYKNTEKSIFKEDYVKFAADIVEKYYRNKDIGENNDFSKDVSTDVLKLLNAKIKMGRMQNDILGLTYKDYKIKITPYQMEKWKENDKEIFLVLRVERSWFYSSDKTTSSELQDITLSKNENGELKMIGCYDQYESITLGPIDQLYKNAKILKTNTDILLDNYIKDFERQCIQKKEQMIIDAKESASCDKNVDLQAKTFLDRIDIKNWARDNYNKNDPVSSSSSVPYQRFRIKFPIKLFSL